VFAGPVVPGAYYVLVDDVGSSGATFMNLAGLIVAGGGKILGLQAFGSGRSGPHIKSLDTGLKSCRMPIHGSCKTLSVNFFGGKVNERQLTPPKSPPSSVTRKDT
jgi:hypothetical protein